MSTVEQLEKDIKEAQVKLDSAQKQLELLKKQAPLGELFIPKCGEDYYSLSYDSGDEGWTANNCNAIRDRTKPYFRTKQAVENYAFALDVLLRLRACDGVVAPINDTQYAIDIGYSCATVFTDNYSSGNLKLTRLSPTFSDREYAQAAIDKVGGEAILKAFKILHGIKV